MISEYLLWIGANVAGSKDILCPLLMLWTALHQPASL